MQAERKRAPVLAALAPHSFFTVTGVTLEIAGISAVLDGDVVEGRWGMVAGVALAVVSEWHRWRRKASG